MWRAVRGSEEDFRKGELFAVAPSSIAQVRSMGETRHTREGRSGSHDLHVSGVLWAIQGSGVGILD